MKPIRPLSQDLPPNAKAATERIAADRAPACAPSNRDVGAALVAMLDQRIQANLQGVRASLEEFARQSVQKIIRDSERLLSWREVARLYRHADRIVFDDIRSGRLAAIKVKSKHSSTGFEIMVKAGVAENWQRERFGAVPMTPPPVGDG